MTYYIAHCDLNPGKTTIYAGADRDAAFAAFAAGVFSDHPALATGRVAVKDYKGNSITLTRSADNHEFWSAVASAAFDGLDNQDFFEGTREEVEREADRYLHPSEDD